MTTIKVMKPCINCSVCGSLRMQNTESGEVLHLGGVNLAEWNLGASWNTETHTGLAIEIKVAQKDDRKTILANRHLFESTTGQTGVDVLPLLINGYTAFDGISFPYLCMAFVKNQLVGKLQIDRNTNNAIRRNLNAAIIDSVAVALSWEQQGIGDKLLEFTEALAESNGIRWLEIGAMRAAEGSDPSHIRRGTDSLRSYIRRGYYKEPLYLNEQLIIHYLAPDLIGASTVITPRYGNAVVVYKDLKAPNIPGKNRRTKLFKEFVSGIPE